MSSIVNKVKNALHSGDNHGENPQSANHGPHSSAAGNKVDPTVDSDRDGSHNLGAASGTHSHATGTHGHTAGHTAGHTTGHTTGHTGATGLGSSNTHSGTTTAGVHNSNILNKADPRVDSDLDGSRNAGLQSHQATHGHTGAGVGAGSGTGLTGSTGTSGVHGSHGTTGLGSTGAGYGSTNAGPHSSNIANSADPRIDSDLDGSRNAGLHSHQAQHGHAGAGIGSTTHNTHNTGAGVGAGSGLGGAHAGTHTGAHAGTHTGAHAGTHGTGPAPSTAGPHSSNLANKLDPRVDSDLDGSKTVGGNKTHQV